MPCASGVSASTGETIRALAAYDIAPLMELADSVAEACERVNVGKTPALAVAVTCYRPRKIAAVSAPKECIAWGW